MPGTVLLMQNVDLGHIKVIQIRQRETLSHQGAIIHEICLSSAQLAAIFILRKDIGVGGWSRKWQFFLALCSENVLT